MPNPILNRNFERECVIDGDVMSINGAVLKSLFLFFTIVLSAGYTWYLALTGFADKVNLLMGGGFIAATISGLVAIWFKPKITPLLAMIYAVCEGFVLGGISVTFEAYYHGIVLSAIMMTFVVLGVMLLLYLTRLIRLTEKLWAVIFTATASIGVIYFIQIVASFFGRSIPQIFTSSGFGIGFSLFVILVAAFNLIVDFSIIEEGSNNRLPKMYEWVGAIGLMFSLVWLYIELLNLFAKMNSRN